MRTYPLCLAFLAGLASAAPKLTFSGELQWVTNWSVAVRLDDGAIIDAENTATHGDLAPAELGKKYAIGDRVEIICERIKGAYHPELTWQLQLELKKLKLLGKEARGTSPTCLRPRPGAADA